MTGFSPFNFHSTPRPLSTAEQTFAERLRSQLQPTAESLERIASVEADATAETSRDRRAKLSRAKRRNARSALWQRANAAHPMGLGVVEIWIAQWVIGQLLNWIMRRWANSGDASDDRQDDSDSD